MHTTFNRLHSGEWGLKGDKLTPGSNVTVTKRDGSTTTAMVGRVVWTGPDGVTLATIIAPYRASKPRQARRGYTPRNVQSTPATVNDTNPGHYADYNDLADPL